MMFMLSVFIFEDACLGYFKKICIIYFAAEKFHLNIHLLAVKVTGHGAKEELIISFLLFHCGKFSFDVVSGNFNSK